MTKKFILGGLCGVVLSIAAAAAAAPIQSGNVTIKKIEFQSDTAFGGGGSTTAGLIYLQFDTAPFTTPCSSNTNGLGNWLLSGNTESLKTMQAIALGAKLAGKPVKVLWNNDSINACSVANTNLGFPVIRGISIL
ncbi:MAG: hypothetical protein EOO73_13685 [Myxococcales bacterium]|nr:MAG: hypothetical protein EOO73_13685 [Myxococcales bacterium]